MILKLLVDTTTS